MFASYARVGVPAGGTVSFALEGRLRQITAGARSERYELLLGGSAFLLAVAAALYVVRLWSQNQAAPDITLSVAVRDDERREALLHALAELDNAYEAGEIGESEYQGQRRELKKALMVIWNRD
jgi:hypothetical protein